MRPPCFRKSHDYLRAPRSDAIGEAARAVVGDGGGHDVAAGATVPAGREREFIDRVDDLVGEQLA